MGIKDRLKGFMDKRRHSAPDQVSVQRPERRVHKIERSVDAAPRRNRAERRFLDHKVRQHAGMLRMRADTRRLRRRRIPRWQARLFRELSGNQHARIRGRVPR